MDASELGRWTRFALKGGIGKGTAVQDCVAEEAEDLMFLKDDEIVVLMQLPEQEDMYLGYCEGVVGRFRGADVRFQGRLKKPVMAKRSSRSLSRSSSRPPSSMSAVNLARESMTSMPQHRDSPSLPTAPIIISRSFSSASLSMSHSSSPNMSAMPSPVHDSTLVPQLHAPQDSLSASDDSHVRSESYSSGSTALDSAPRTPADFTQEGLEETSSLVRIASLSRQVTSPTEMSSEGHESLNSDEKPAIKEPPPELPPVREVEQEVSLIQEAEQEVSLHENHEMSYLDSEPSTRISAAYSEGDAVEGIGLSLLQNFIGGEVDDDDDDVRSFSSRTSTPEPSPRPDAVRAPPPDSTIEGGNEPTIVGSRLPSTSPRPVPSVRSVTDSVYSTVSVQQHQSDADSLRQSLSPPASPRGPVASVHSGASSTYSNISPRMAPPGADATHGSMSPPTSPNAASIHSRASSVHSSASPRLPPPDVDAMCSSLSPPVSPRDMVPPSPSRNSIHPSMTDSEYDGAEWEGASDIYDNYRYSRYSMASKASRFSKGSMHTVASAFGLEAPPPVPFDGRRPSLDSVNQGLGRSRLGSAATASSSVEDVRRVLASGTSSKHSSASVDVAPVSSEGRRVPPPLDLQDSPHTKQPSISASVSDASNTSPLLHGSFGSPLGSPTPASTTFTQWTPSPIQPLFSSRPGGAATAIRQRLEQERGPGDPPDSEELNDSLQVELVASGKARLSTQPIVVEDDDTGPRSSIVAVEERSETLSSPPLSPSAASEKKRMIETTFIVANQAPPPPYSPEAPVDEPAVPGPSSTAQHAQLQPADESLPPARPRPANPNAVQNEFMRQSLFMPHPSAPKPASMPAGPMYGRAPMPPSMYQRQGPPAGSAIPTLHMVLAIQSDPHRPRRITIYGKFDQDLSTSVGPVPISFTLEPPNNIPANKLRAMTTPVASPPPTNTPLSTRSSSASLPQRAPSAPIPPASPSAVSDMARASTSSAPSGPIPRPNFFPKTQTPRPRSRSFSGFDSTAAAELGVPTEEGVNVAKPISQSASLNSVSRPPSSNAVGPSPSPSPTPSSTSGTSTSAPKLLHKPSPLSLSQNNIVAERSPTSPHSPASPLSRSPIVGPDTTQRAISPLASPTMSLGQASLAMSPPMPQSSLPSAESSASRSVHRSPSAGSSPPSPVKTRTSILRHSKSSTFGSRQSSETQSRSSFQGRRSGETDSLHDARSTLTSPPPFAGPPLANTLKSKLSLPALKLREIRNSDRPSLQEERSPTQSVMSLEGDKPRVQVKDVDFELVRPGVQQLASIEEGSPTSPLPSPIRPDIGSLRAESPAFSVLSGVSAYSKQPLTPSQLDAFPPPPTEPKPPAQDPQEVEAHRQRELKWISMMSTVPAPQARKNKKVRKLLWEGVPASVRYLVWAHLTDSKAKRIEGLYSKMVTRERVPAATNIERDLKRVFPDDRQLHDGSLLNVLQAYLSMVPDISYGRGLTVIAGHLLLQSPEEDAFWTFVSLMDAHLRPYFSVSAAQMEADAMLFGKAVESMDSALAKKLFVDLDIPAASLCRPWFSALFLEALPLEYSQRVWDIFLFEGVSFLFRVGLAIVSCCKQTVLRTAERDPILHLLLHPPSALLPATADAFLEVAASVKLKDDDVRKQRLKLAEAQAKRPPQPRNLSSQTPKIVERVPTPSLVAGNASSISVVRG